MRGVWVSCWLSNCSAPVNVFSTCSPSWLPGWVRLLNTGQVNKNDPNDARSVAVAALRAGDLREVVVEGDTAVMKLWARRYRDLGSARTQLVCRLHAVLCELVPGGFAREISAAQAIQVLDDITTHGPGGRRAARARS